MPIYAITGANRGLGLEFVRQLSQDPSNTLLALVRNSSADLTDLKSASAKNESNTHVLTCDTGDISSIKSWAQEAKKTLGDKKIDYLINNAGVNHASTQTSLTMEAEDLNENVRINVIGPAKTTQYAVEAGILAPEVRIVNMTSGLGSMQVSLSITPRKCAPYSISKAGLNALTVQQSGEVVEKLGGKAVVICMDPGWVKTRMGGEGAVLEPEESIGGMLKCIHGLTSEDNGGFRTYTGKPVPW
jgi:NAD(P)-dependent dehydrogenase (short-subunit alcohol dehydrogenase family)